jgi:hypothetical protein
VNEKSIKRPETVSYLGVKPPELEFIESPELQLVREIISQNSRILEQNERILEYLTSEVQFPSFLTETKR